MKNLQFISRSWLLVNILIDDSSKLSILNDSDLGDLERINSHKVKLVEFLLLIQLKVNSFGFSENVNLDL